MTGVLDGTHIGRGWFIGRVGNVIVIHAQVEVKDPDFDFYLRFLAETIDGTGDAERRAALYDLGRGSSTSAQRRKRLAGVLASRRSKLERVLVGCAVSSPSPVARGIATALVWLTSPPCEVRFVPSPADGFAWIATLMPGMDAAAASRSYDALKKACCESPRFR